MYLKILIYALPIVTSIQAAEVMRENKNEIEIDARNITGSYSVKIGPTLQEKSKAEELSIDTPAGVVTKAKFFDVPNTQKIHVCIYNKVAKAYLQYSVLDLSVKNGLVKVEYYLLNNGNGTNIPYLRQVN